LLRHIAVYDRPVSHFLVVYDRATGELLRMERYESDDSALQARFRAESEFSARGGVEIVALTAATEDDLRRTHGRYFLDAEDLAARLA
jgi:hypothetical protein